MHTRLESGGQPGGLPVPRVVLLLGVAEANEVAAAERELDRSRALTFGLIRTAS